ncbi:MAG TPA: cyclic nucleotide-binding domain-containing protein [Chthoniobacterales bacterium]
MNSSKLAELPKPQSGDPFEERVELHPFLVGLRPHHIKLLSDCAMATSFQPDGYLFRQGEFANRFYLIEQGRVALEALDPQGDSVVIEEVGPGRLVGWSWLFPPYVWHFDARATEPTTALFFYGTILREYCAKYPSLGFELFKRMSQVMLERLQGARMRLLTHSARAD